VWKSRPRGSARFKKAAAKGTRSIPKANDSQTRLVRGTLPASKVNWTHMASLRPIEIVLGVGGIVILVEFLERGR
jgi:hypothetical protein